MMPFLIYVEICLWLALEGYLRAPEIE